jgi:hypothetical protein
MCSKLDLNLGSSPQLTIISSDIKCSQHNVNDSIKTRERPKLKTSQQEHITVTSITTITNPYLICTMQQRHVHLMIVQVMKEFQSCPNLRGNQNHQNYRLICDCRDRNSKWNTWWSILFVWSVVSCLWISDWVWSFIHLLTFHKIVTRFTQPIDIEIVK